MRYWRRGRSAVCLLSRHPKDRCFPLFAEKQARDRIHRIGQRKQIVDLTKMVGARAKNGKGKSQADGVPQVDLHGRDINWFPPETTHLLNVARQVQIEVGRSDLKFTAPEWNAIWESFHRRTPTYQPPNQRGVDQLKNKFKALRAEFTNIKTLISRSGWRWNANLHQVQAPDEEAWKELRAQNKIKWGPYQKKVWPYLELFTDLIGISLPTGDQADCSAVGAHSEAGSSDGAADPLNEPVNDSSEQARFQFEEMAHAMPEETVQGVAEDLPAGADRTSAGTAGASARTGGSNKRKSSDATEGSRTRRAKKSIRDRASRDDGVVATMGEMVQTTRQLVQQNEEIIAIQKARMELGKQQVESQTELNTAKKAAQTEAYRQTTRPREIISILVGFGLNWEQRSKVMEALNNPDLREMFTLASEFEQKNKIADIIPGFFQWNAGGANVPHQSYMNYFNNVNASNFNP